MWEINLFSVWKIWNVLKLIVSFFWSTGLLPWFTQSSINIIRALIFCFWLLKFTHYYKLLFKILKSLNALYVGDTFAASDVTRGGTADASPAYWGSKTPSHRLQRRLCLQELWLGLWSSQVCFLFELFISFQFYITLFFKKSICR